MSLENVRLLVDYPKVTSDVNKNESARRERERRCPYEHR